MCSRRRRGQVPRAGNLGVEYVHPEACLLAAASQTGGERLGRSRGRGARRRRPLGRPCPSSRGSWQQVPPWCRRCHRAENDVRRAASISSRCSSVAVPTAREPDRRRIASRSSSPADLLSSCWAGPPSARPLRLLARPRARLPPWRAPLCRPRTGVDRLGLGAGGWGGGAGPGAARAPPPTWGCQWRASAGSQGRRRPLGPTGRASKQPWERLTPSPALGRGWGRGRGWRGPRPHLLACPLPGAR